VSTAVMTTVVQCEHCGKKNRVPVVGDGIPRCGNCHRPLPWIVDAGDDSFSEVAELAKLPVLVDMWAVWCGPCRMVSPALEQVARELAGRVKLVKVDVDAAPKLSQRFAVQAVPTLMVLRNGEVIARQSGAAPAPAIRRWVEDAIGTDDGAPK
jgi:thioredoxin 2